MRVPIVLFVGRLAPGPIVLVVDDEPDIRHLFSRVLEGGGFTCVEAATAEEAGSLLEQGLAPGAILLDLWMPGMGGLGLLRHVRADARFAHLPVTIVTGDCFITPSLEAAVTALRAPVRFKPMAIETILTLTHDMMDPRLRHA